MNSISWVRWGAILGGWTLLSLFFVPEVYLYFLYKQEPLPWWTVVLLTAANTAVAAVFVPGIVALTHSFPFGRLHWKRSLLVHIPACIAFSLAHSFLYAGLCYASPVFHVLFLRFHPNLITYWAIVGITEAVDYFQKLKEREAELARAQTELLKNQLHPHLMFNTLHAISTLMREDVKAADRMLVRLSELLRLTLDGIGKQEVSLRQELEFVERYLDIQRVRFQENLALHIEVDPAALDCPVPSVLLQPLVENSFRHGFAPRRNSGAIWISGRRDNGYLELNVADDGTGFPHGAGPLREGIGLKNVRLRLERLYPSHHSLSFHERKGGGAVVSIQIPWHPQPDEG